MIIICAEENSDAKRRIPSEKNSLANYNVMCTLYSRQQAWKLDRGHIHAHNIQPKVKDNAAGELSLNMMEMFCGVVHAMRNNGVDNFKLIVLLFSNRSSIVLSKTGVALFHEKINNYHPCDAVVGNRDLTHHFSLRPFVEIAMELINRPYNKKNHCFSSLMKNLTVSHWFFAVLETMKQSKHETIFLKCKK